MWCSMNTNEIWLKSPRMPFFKNVSDKFWSLRSTNEIICVALIINILSILKLICKNRKYFKSTKVFFSKKVEYWQLSSLSTVDLKLISNTRLSSNQQFKEPFKWWRVLGLTYLFYTCKVVSTCLKRLVLEKVWIFGNLFLFAQLQAIHQGYHASEYMTTQQYEAAAVYPHHHHFKQHHFQ